MAVPVGVTHKLSLTYIESSMEHKTSFYVNCASESDDPLIEGIGSIPDILMSDFGELLISQIKAIFFSSTVFNTLELYRWDTAGPQESWELITAQAVEGTGETGAGGGPQLTQQFTITLRDTSGKTARFALFETHFGTLFARYPRAALPEKIGDFVDALLTLDVDNIGGYVLSRGNRQLNSFYQAAATQNAHIYKERVGFS